MSKIRNIISQQKVSTRIKFMLQDVLELRNVRTVLTCWQLVMVLSPPLKLRPYGRIEMCILLSL